MASPPSHGDASFSIPDLESRRPQQLALFLCSPLEDVRRPYSAHSTAALLHADTRVHAK